MTREQQAADRALEDAEANWLIAYGWQRVSRHEWKHPRARGVTTFPTRDAIAETRANAHLGWPDRGFR